MSEDIKSEDQDIEDIFKDETIESNEADENDSEDASEKLSTDALAEYNERVGKSYKSWDDVAKREKEADKAFAKGEHKEQKASQPPNQVSDEIVEELLLTKYPEAEEVLDELKETAELKGVSVLKLYRDSKYFQGEAKAIADAKKLEEENRSKISKPSVGAESSNKVDISKVKAEDVSKLDPANKIAWMKAQAKKERNSID